MAQGHISWVALLSTGLSDADLVALANGTKVLVDDFSANIVELWDMAANAATITGSSGHVLTRVGTGFGTDGTDPLPYTTGSTTIAFSGTIATQNGNVDSVFSLDVSSYFSGSETPFSYSLQAGTLPAGLSLSGSVISGTPTGVETQAGIVIRGTDTATSTADSNTFSIDIAAAIVSTKGIQITLNSRASLEPVVSVTAITARFWDSATAAGAPLLKTDTASLDGSGVIELDIDSVTSLSVGDYGYLSLYKAGATPADDLHFAGRVPVVDIGA
ncbi:putative Ig domain-containing protein [Nitrosospira sp. Nl5]|uniref:putative Ig domain-containing protein n=1 Tax=Nitrosospira sp. Nl5 TaxID=200120 RepID=UPI000B80BE5B|nr:putative Ig domain-containing protein [Nitrosospira sp. Nl5]